LIEGEVPTLLSYSAHATLNSEGVGRIVSHIKDACALKPDAYVQVAEALSKAFPAQSHGAITGPGFDIRFQAANEDGDKKPSRKGRR
jgi:hypothetical protein